MDSNGGDSAACGQSTVDRQDGFSGSTLVFPTTRPKLLAEQGLLVTVFLNGVLTWDSPFEFHLVTGVVHMLVAPSSQVAVQMEFGIARSTGAEFLITADLSGVEITIQEGVVQVDLNSGSYAFENNRRGQKLVVTILADYISESFEPLEP